MMMDYTTSAVCEVAAERISSAILCVAKAMRSYRAAHDAREDLKQAHESLLFAAGAVSEAIGRLEELNPLTSIIS